MVKGHRTTLLEKVASHILSLPDGQIQRVCVDGVDGAGKTTFADELSRVMETSGRHIIRAGVDHFHNKRETRYAKGKSSPEGFYLDSYNYDALIKNLLEPLSPGGNGRFRRAAFDHRTDSAVDSPWEQAPPGSILILDGIFLQRPELVRFWDFSIFLQVGFSVSIPRGAERDEGHPDPAAPENRRYVEGQRLYLAQCDPAGAASTTIDNEILEFPKIIRSWNQSASYPSGAS